MVLALVSLPYLSQWKQSPHHTYTPTSSPYIQTIALNLKTAQSRELPVQLVPLLCSSVLVYGSHRAGPLTSKGPSRSDRPWPARP